jgi:hypothetical protein
MIGLPNSAATGFRFPANMALGMVGYPNAMLAGNVEAVGGRS